MSWAAVGAVGVVALSGCVDGGEPEPSTIAPPTSSPSSVPTDEELIAEARSVYESYLVAAVSMWGESEVDYTLLLDWASVEVATDEAAGQQALRDEGVVNSGPIVVAAFESAGGTTVGQVDAFVCLDFTQAIHLDSQGNDVTPADAVDFAPLQLRFERVGSPLVLSAQEGLPAGVETPCP